MCGGGEPPTRLAFLVSGGRGPLRGLLLHAALPNGSGMRSWSRSMHWRRRHRAPPARPRADAVCIRWDSCLLRLSEPAESLQRVSPGGGVGSLCPEGSGGHGAPPLVQGSLSAPQGLCAPRKHARVFRARHLGVAVWDLCWAPIAGPDTGGLGSKQGFPSCGLLCQGGYN